MNIMKIDYDDEAKLSPDGRIDNPRFMQININVDPSMTSPIREKGTSDVYFITLHGPLSLADLMRLSDYAKGRGAENARPLSVHSRTYYMEGSGKAPVMYGIMRSVPEDPNDINCVDLYGGERFVKRFFPSKTEVLHLIP